MDFTRPLFPTGKTRDEEKYKMNFRISFGCYGCTRQ
jgi:hypothetical protein